MEEQAPHRILIAHLGKRAIAEPTTLILEKMGYVIVPDSEWNDWSSQQRSGMAQPDLRLVDDRCMTDVPPISESPEPIILLTDRHGAKDADPRVVGAVMRPAGLHDLYRLLQGVLEETPRTAPRVATNLRARLAVGEEEWGVAILSLSENGCLLRTAEDLIFGTHLRVSFTLPQFGEINTEAEVAYQMLPDFGLVFDATPSASREAIVAFVNRTMAAA